VSRVPTILCIDDEVLGLEIRKVVLEREGYLVYTATDQPESVSFGSSPSML
jgi:CheY-like chemotaxis protein